MKSNGFSCAHFGALILPLAILLTLLNAPNLSATQHAIADQFTRKVHAFKKVVVDGRGNWMSPPSPWIPYIDRQYWEGLRPAQQKQYLMLQKKGWCDELMKLEEIGFLDLYPELSDALSDKIVKNIFLDEVVPSHSFGARRCQAHAMLVPIIEREKKLDPQLYYLTIPGTNLGNKPDVIYDAREINLRKAFKIIFDLAACEDYKPAIKDIIEFRKLFLIFVGNDEVYYFIIRANHYGLDTSGFVPVVLDLPQSELSPRLQKIQYFLERGDLDAARKVVFDLTYISCGRSESE